MDVILVVDMQVGLLDGPSKHELQSVIGHINALTGYVRHRGGQVIWVRHCGKQGDNFERDTAGWDFLPELSRSSADQIVEKTLNDPFAGTSLLDDLTALQPDRILICGWATDFCVDASVRSSVCNNFHVVVASDAHTLNDRPHLPANDVITHHNWLWAELLTHKSIQVMPTAAIVSSATAKPGVGA